MENNVEISSKKFAALLLQHQQKLLALLHSIVFDKRAIPDLLQEINVDLLDREAEYDTDLNFFPWASTRARFVVKSYFRDKKRNRIEYNSEVIDCLWEPAVQFIENEYDHQADLLRQCVEKLPESQRNLIELHYGQGYTPAQIAVKLGKKPNTVSQILHRIRLTIINSVEKKRKITIH